MFVGTGSMVSRIQISMSNADCNSPSVLSSLLHSLTRFHLISVGSFQGFWVQAYLHRSSWCCEASGVGYRTAADWSEYYLDCAGRSMPACERSLICKAWKIGYKASRLKVYGCHW